MSTWSRVHQIRYLSATVLVLALAASGTYWLREPEPTCTDNTKNQGELGVDCGGPCSRICRDQATPLIVKWVQVFPVRAGFVDVAAYITNPNPSFALAKLRYRFKVYDSRQILISEREGETFINKGEQFVLFEPLIATKERVAERAFIEFISEEQLEWTRDIGRRMPELTVGNKVVDTSSAVPTVRAHIANTSTFDAFDVRVAAVLLDDSGNALGVSQTKISRLKRLDKAPVVLTWPIVFVRPVASAELYFHIPPQP